MLVDVIDGFTARMLKAIEDNDFDELRSLDAACLRFLQEHLSPSELDEKELEQVMASLQRLKTTYVNAVANCTAARDQLRDSIQATGRGRRNAVQYLDVARNLGH